MYRIREMNKADCAMVHQVEQQCFSDPWSLESIEQSFHNSSSHYFVALENDIIVGFIGLLIAIPESDIINVAVLPEFTGKGIGKHLVEKALVFLKQNKVNKVYLEVRASNQRAVALYGRFEFKPVGIRKQYYGNPIEDAIVMCLELNGSYKVFPL